MVFTLNELSTPTHYGYLGLYNLAYVVPRLAIVGVFVWTLASHKLAEREGRFLELLCGMMMLGLGAMLLSHPASPENVLAAISIMASALVVATVVSAVDRRRLGRVYCPSCHCPVTHRGGATAPARRPLSSVTPWQKPTSRPPLNESPIGLRWSVCSPSCKC